MRVAYALTTPTQTPWYYLGRVTCWHCCLGTAPLRRGTPGVKTESHVGGFPGAGMTNAFVKLAVLCGQGGGCAGLLSWPRCRELVDFHIFLCPPQLRQESGSKASVWSVQRRLGCTQWLAAALWCCLVVTNKLIGKIHGNMGKNKCKSTGVDSYSRYQDVSRSFECAFR